MSYKKYVKDYKAKLVSVNDGRGMKEIYVYTGDYFTAGIQDGQRGRVLATIVVCCIGCILCFAGAGLIDCGGMRQFYVAVPFAVSLLPLGMMTAGVWRCVREKEPLKREAVDHGWHRTKGMSMFAAIVAGISAVASVVYMLIAKDFSGGQIVFTLLMALFAGLAFWVWRTVQKKCNIHQLEEVKSGQNS